MLTPKIRSASLRQQLARGGVLLVGSQLLSVALSVGSTVYLARYIAPEAFGIFALCVMLVGFAAFVVDLGLSTATIRHPEISQNQLSAVFWYNFLAGCVLALTLSSAAGPLANYFGQPDLKQALIVSTAALPISALGLQHNALLIRRAAYSHVAKVNIGSQLIGIAVGVGISFLSPTYWALVAMTIATATTNMALSWTKTNWWPSSPFPLRASRALFNFGSHLSLSNLIHQASQRIDTLLIGRYIGAAELGIYDRSRQLFLMPLFQLITPLSNLAVPTLSRLHAEQNGFLHAFYRMQAQMQFLVTIITVIAISVGSAVIVWLLGSKWAQAGEIFTIIAVSGFVISIPVSFSWALIAAGKSQVLSAWAPAGLFIRLILLAIAVSDGIWAAAIAMTAANYVSCILFLLLVAPSIEANVKSIFGNIFPALVGGHLAFAATQLLQVFYGAPVDAISVATRCITGLSVFAAGYLVFPLARSTMMDVVESLRSISRKADAA